jgi:hypothetical protein
MDTLCTPTIITAALFVAIVFTDLLRHEFENLPGHSMLGVISVLLMAGLCQRGAIIVAWGLLLVPLTVLFILLIIELSKSSSNSVTPSGCPPCINTDEPTQYRGAFMYRDYDWDQGSNATNTPSNSAGTGTSVGTGSMATSGSMTTSGSRDLPVCGKCPN